MENDAVIKKLLNKASALPFSPGVYIMQDRNGKVIYVGKSSKLKNRVSQYFQSSEKDTKTSKMVSHVYDFDYILCDTEIEALVLENSLIKKHTPRYNIRLKDAKSYPYIKITDEAYPKIMFTRKRLNDRAKYFGPYSGVSTVYSILNILQRTLGLPSCKRKFPADIGKERSCIYYQMKQCCGVCTGNINESEYNSLVSCAIDILRGNTASALRELRNQMQKYSEEQRYEAAARARDTISALEKIGEKQHIVANPEEEEDIIALYVDEFCSSITIFYVREGALSDKQEYVFGAEQIIDDENLVSFLSEHYSHREYIPQKIYYSFDLNEESIELLYNYISTLSPHKVTIKKPQKGDIYKLANLAYTNAMQKAKAYKFDSMKDDKRLIKLAEMLSLEVVPERIEAYDISNLGEEHKTAGMIVCEKGKLKPSEYRSFNIKTVEGTDDYACMYEAISRRIEHLNDSLGSFSKYPDLILLDGGMGHVNVIKKLFKEKDIDIPVFGMVKDDYHKTRQLCSDNGEIDIAKEQSVFSLIYQIQEEVHRYSINKMTNAKRNTIRHSTLERVKGIGAVKAKNLLSTFGGLSEIKKANIDDIASVKGITSVDAINIYKFFNKNN